MIVHRARKSISGSGDQDAVKMSEILPFVEFDLQKQLMLKLKVFGMNAAMGYTSTVISFCLVSLTLASILCEYDYRDSYMYRSLSGFIVS